MAKIPKKLLAGTGALGLGGWWAASQQDEQDEQNKFSKQPAGITNTASTAPDVETDETSEPEIGLDKMINDYMTVIQNTMPTYKAQDYTDKLNEIKQELALNEKTRADKEQRLEKKELASTLANALGRIGAGVAGLQTGTDLSAVSQLQPTDFSKQLDRALAEYDSKRTGLERLREAYIERQGREKEKEVESGQQKAKTLADLKFRLGAAQLARQQKLTDTGKDAGLKEEQARLRAQQRMQQAQQSAINILAELESPPEKLTAAQKQARIKALQDNLTEAGLGELYPQVNEALQDGFFTSPDYKTAVQLIKTARPAQATQPSQQAAQAAGQGNVIKRRAADGRIIVYDAVTKQPLYEEK